MPEPLAMGIDVGGTNLRAGLVTLDAVRVVARSSLPTRPERGGKSVLEDVEALARRMVAAASNRGSQILRLGLGVCELVDLEGQVTSAHTIDWTALPVHKRLSVVAPTVIQADVRAQASAEAHFGSGRPFANFVYVAAGTGISMCWVRDGLPYPGSNGNALLLGNSYLVAECAGTPIGSELLREAQYLPLEDFAAGPALTRRYGDGAKEAEEIFARAEDGDPHAVHVLKTGGRALGRSVALLVNLLDPEAVVIGGGLGLAGGLYWESLDAAVRTDTYVAGARSLPLLKASLGPDAGIIGAAMAGHLPSRTR